MIFTFEFFAFGAICVVACASLHSPLQRTLTIQLEHAIHDVKVNVPVSGSNVSLSLGLNDVKGGSDMNILNSQHELSHTLFMRGRILQFVGYYRINNENLNTNQITGGAFSFTLDKPEITITFRTPTGTRKKRQSGPPPPPDEDYSNGIPPPPGPPPGPPPSPLSDPPSGPPSGSSSVFRFISLSGAPSSSPYNPPPSPPSSPLPGSQDVFRFSPLSGPSANLLFSPRSGLRSGSSRGTQFDRKKRESNPPQGPPRNIPYSPPFSLGLQPQYHISHELVEIEDLSVTLESNNTLIWLGPINNGDINLYNTINSYVNSRSDKISTKIQYEIAEALRTQFLLALAEGTVALP